MIRIPDLKKSMTIDIILKTGVEYLNRDVPGEPFGVHGAVSCWIGDNTLIVFPMSEVSSIKLNFKE